MPDATKRLSPLLRIPLRYGVIGGLLGAALMIVLYYINIHPLLVAIFFDFRVALFGVLMFFILKEFRDFNNGGTMAFSQGMLMCLIFILTFAVIASALIWTFAIIIPAFVIDYIELATKQLKAFPPDTIEQIGRNVYEASLADLPKTKNFDLVSLYFVQCFLIGFFVSIIISVILRRQPAANESQTI